MAASEVLDIRDYTEAIYRRRRWVIVSTLVGAILALGLSLSQQKMYTSESEVLVLPATIPGQVVSPNALISMPNELQVARSASVEQAAAGRAAQQDFTLGDVVVANPVDTQTLTFAATSPDPKSAQSSAAAYAEAYLELRKENLTSSIQDRLTSVQGVIDGLQTERSQLIDQLARASAGPESTALTYQLTSLGTELADRQAEENDLQLALGAEVGATLEEATLPGGPSSPKPIRNTILGAFLGFLVGLVLALLRDRFDQRVRDRQAVEQIVDAPVLGIIPHTPSLHRMLALRPGGDPAAAEAFRALRTRVIYAALKQGYRSIMITSAEPYAGKTATAANLAVALAQADTRVVLVSGDLHRAGLWRYFPERKKVGLADVLAGDENLDDVLIPTDQDNLWLLPSGTVDKLPEAALGSPEMLAVIQQLRQRADIVLVDSAPVLGVSDALDLASVVDAALLTVDARTAKKGMLRETVDDLRSVGATIMGVAFHRPERSHFEGYPYQYRRDGGDGAARPGAVPVEEGAARGDELTAAGIEAMDTAETIDAGATTNGADGGATEKRDTPTGTVERARPR